MKSGQGRSRYREAVGGLLLISLALGLVACNERSAEPVAPPGAAVAPAPEPSQLPIPLQANPAIDRMVAARQAVLIGNRAEAEKLMQEMTPGQLRAANIPDPRRPIDVEKAGALVKAMEGVQSINWLDRSNVVVIMASAKQIDAYLIDRICLAMETLGDSLAVVVTLQHGSASDLDNLITRSRNCGLPEGQRALMFR